MPAVALFLSLKSNLQFNFQLPAMRLLAFSSVLSLLSAVHAAEPSGGDLYPPGLLPLINRANVLLSTGQFNEAAKVYTEAIGEFDLWCGKYFLN